MIITTTRHGRSRADTRALLSHLTKEGDQKSRVIAIGNAPVRTAADAFRYMEAMRDGSHASVAFHHITLSPTRLLTPTERDAMVRRVLEALGPEPVPVDELIRGCQLSAPVVATVLLEAELAGLVGRYPGNLVARHIDLPV